MELIKINNKEEYNSVNRREEYSQFSQSWEWGEFQKEAGNEVERFGLKEDGGLFFSVTAIVKKIPAGMSYYYLPRVQNKHLTGEHFDFLVSEIKKADNQRKILFIRIEPVTDLPKLDYVIKKTIHVQPEKTLILDLSKEEDELLKSMHQKTRYNIRLAAKKGVEINISGKDNFDDFWSIMEKTGQRDGFRLHGKDYYKKMLKLPALNGVDFNKNDLQLKLVTAKYDDSVICANIVAFYGNMVTYVHGASGDKYRNAMAPYLLQWETIKMAKEAGYKYYDFFGIDEKKWPGVTRFKKGFSGEYVEYPGAYDIVFGPVKYYLYNLARRVSRFIRK